MCCVTMHITDQGQACEKIFRGNTLRQSERTPHVEFGRLTLLSPALSAQFQLEHNNNAIIKRH